jgi:hypothetical protein
VVDGSSPVLLPLCGDIRRGPALSILFVAGFTPLSTYSQGGDREFSWSGLPLMPVLTNAKVRTSNTGQPLPITEKTPK